MVTRETPNSAASTSLAGSRKPLRPYPAGDAADERCRRSGRISEHGCRKSDPFQSLEFESRKTGEAQSTTSRGRRPSPRSSGCSHWYWRR
jgi:hypothetical protein